MEWRWTRWQGLNGSLAPHPRERRSALESTDRLRDDAAQSGARVFMSAPRVYPAD